MAKVTINTRAIREALESIIPKIKSPESMRKYGKLAADMIQLRTRLGSSVSRDGAEKKPLKRLAPATVESRKRDKKKGLLSGLTSPGKSNLTRTQQLLDSVSVKKVGYGTASVAPKGTRTDGLTNEKVAEYVTKAGRPFNNLSKIEVKRLQDAVKRDLRALIKGKLTKR